MPGVLLALAAALVIRKAGLASVALVLVAGLMPWERPQWVPVEVLAARPRGALGASLTAWTHQVLVEPQAQGSPPSTARRRCLPCWLVEVEGVQTP